MTIQDDFVAELQHAAGQVGPVAGLDGSAMGRRAVRRGRARRGALAGAAALAAVGAVVGAGLLTDGPAAISPAASDVPEGWTPVAVGGVRLALPPGLEPGADGVWEGTQDEGRQDFVQVQPADDGTPLAPPGSGLTPAAVDVPGAESAQYVTETSDDPAVAQDFTGTLHVHLGSGAVVQVVVVWGEADEGEDTFAELVGTVSVDDDSPALPAPDAVPELQPLAGYVREVPDGWREAELTGLGYAFPAGWLEDRSPAGVFPAGSTVRATSADGASRLSVTRAADSAGWPASIAPSSSHPASTFPLDGADVVQVETRTADRARTVTAKVRREGGRGYLVTVETPGTAAGRTLALQVLGTLGFVAGSEEVPGPDELPQLPTAAVPRDWTEARSGGLRLSVPPAWTAGSTAGAAVWTSGPEAGRAQETVRVSRGTVVDGVAPAPSGYRHDVPGADRVVVEVGERAGRGDAVQFVGTVELSRGDQMVVVEYAGPQGGDAGERFGMIVRSLALTGG
ncbi:hypothetical protein GCM10007368_31230 [Isoptericola cucumis]|uniref:Uncharacterized protein n=1 Tax=Isoptericola cucumis TaxID=1776856 RepID=A0ABQ2B8B3_9MICO|nr:hypothetical protein GCM10007368_31230 [Isoptericola cucumis]